MQLLSPASLVRGQAFKLVGLYQAAELAARLLSDRVSTLMPNPVQEVPPTSSCGNNLENFAQPEDGLYLVVTHRALP